MTLTLSQINFLNRYLAVIAVFRTYPIHLESVMQVVHHSTEPNHHQQDIADSYQPRFCNSLIMQ